VLQEFNSVFPVDIFWVKSPVNDLFLKPLKRGSNHNLIPKRIVSGLISMFWNGSGPSTYKP